MALTVAAALVVTCGACQVGDPVDEGTETSGEAPYLGPDFVYSTDWVSDNEGVWGEVLQSLVGKPKLSYLEVGVYEGRSLIWMFENILTGEGCRATAVDIYIGPPAEAYDHNVALAGLTDRVTKVKGSSRDTLRTMLPHQFDLIYVDGSHAGIDVLTDLVLAWDLLKYDGMMILDDYLMDTTLTNRKDQGPSLPPALRPGGAIDALLSVYSQQIEVLHADYQVIIRKVRNSCLTGRTGGQHERVKWCTAVGPYAYFWNRPALYFAEDATKVPLTEDERTTLEAMLGADVRWLSPFRVPRVLAENPAFAPLVERLELGIEQMEWAPGQHPDPGS